MYSLSNSVSLNDKTFSGLQHPIITSRISYSVPINLAGFLTSTPNVSLSQRTEEEEGREISATISKYSIIRTLGQGSSGKVFLAQYNGEVYAIKKVSRLGTDFFDTEENYCELRTLLCINRKASTNITSCFVQNILGNFQDDNGLYMVLEYHPLSLCLVSARLRLRKERCEDPTSIASSNSLPTSFLSQQTISRGLPLTRLCLLAAEITLGLLFLHGIGIIQQDIKPANILISRSGHVIIGDFGASHSYTKTSNGSNPIKLRPQDIVSFTPLYAAPELIHRNAEGVVEYDERVDWWSFGIMIYELATGTFPFLFPIKRPLFLVREDDSRSESDLRLSFSDLDRIIKAAQEGRAFERYNIEVLKDFIKSLLVHDSHDRLSGTSVKEHQFFTSIQLRWDEIADQQHPPLFDLLEFDSLYSGMEKDGESNPSHGSETSVEFSMRSQSTIRSLLPLSTSMDDSRSVMQPFPSSASIVVRPLTCRTQTRPILSTPRRASSLVPNIYPRPSSLKPLRSLRPRRQLNYKSPVRSRISTLPLRPKRPRAFGCALGKRSWTLEEKITISVLEATRMREYQHTISGGVGRVSPPRSRAKRRNGSFWKSLHDHLNRPLASSSFRK